MQQLHKNCLDVFSLMNSSNVLVKTVSFRLERLHRYGVLKCAVFIGPPCKRDARLLAPHVVHILYMTEELEERQDCQEKTVHEV